MPNRIALAEKGKFLYVPCVVLYVLVNAPFVNRAVFAASFFIEMIVRFLLFAPVLLCFSGCIGLGYQAGAPSLFGQDVKTVYVPVFESDPTRRHLAERITEAVCKRIEERTPYKIVSQTAADSILEGRIAEKTQTVSLIDANNDPRQKSDTLSVEVRWMPRNARHPASKPAWNSSENALISVSEYRVAEFGHSQLTSEQNQINRIADKIAAMMENNW
ncbi:MAG: LPS assembly lipoprotein LptE [Planctomycetaceae bacterium]|jgi:hypothetical protein|nr:LPS assembly lipoprotein LptE [Planctomycetaceae bacterium]